MGNFIISNFKKETIYYQSRFSKHTASYLNAEQNGNGNKNQTHANYKEEDVVASMKRSRAKEARVISLKLRGPSSLAQCSYRNCVRKNCYLFIIFSYSN